MRPRKQLHDYDKYKPGDGHYDRTRKPQSERDARRLILLAECQVGKTGAYLHYLQLLTRAATTVAIPPPPPPHDGGPLPRDVLSWLLPCWDTLFCEKPLSATYGTLFPSKYTVGVAKERASLVMRSCKPEGAWVKRFQELLRNVSGERITSEAGEALIKKLDNEAVAPFDKRGQATRAPGSLESLKAAIDWDGRFRSHGVRLCVCDGQCSPECQPGAPKFGEIPTIRVADLARTGGQSDAVRGRWEKLRLESRKGGRLTYFRYNPANRPCGCSVPRFNEVVELYILFAICQ